MSKRSSRRLGRTIFSTLAVLTAAGAAQAESGFSVNRFEPSEAGGRWFAADSLDISGHLRPSIGVVSDWAHKPLVSYTSSGAEKAVLSQDQLFVHIRGSLVAWDRVRLGVSAPVLAYQRGTTVVLPGDETFAAGTQVAAGDLRLSGDVRLHGEPGSALRVAAGTSVYLPTGDPGSLSGEKAVRVRPRVQFAGQQGSVVYAAHAGAHVRFEDVEFAGHTLGSEAMMGGAAGVQLMQERLLVGVVMNLATALDDKAFAADRTPFEAQLVAHYDVAPDWRVGAGFGPGLGQGVGVPASRVMLSAEWFPTAPTETAPPVAPDPDPDQDGDGIPDFGDACPIEAGTAHSEPSRHGCPDKDTDADGVIDEEDQCPAVAGVSEAIHGQPLGCPEVLDTDGDGVNDDTDQCPNESGPVDEVASGGRVGCPPAVVDTDGDGIEDAQDSCATEAGVASKDPTLHGCPAPQTVSPDVDILERVEFGPSGSTLSAGMTQALQRVVRVLQDNPQIRKVRVEGHADSRGDEAVNERVSLARAREVVAWMVQQGIAAERLIPVGKGETYPRASNETEEGRQANRRVEFVVAERD